MSELIGTQRGTSGIRELLLATASALALFAMTGSAAADGDFDHPLVWIELGGQFDAVNDGHEAFTPPYLLATPRPDFETGSFDSLQRGPRLGWDGDARLVFQPTDTDWVLSASVRYGRALRSTHEHDQPPPVSVTSGSGYAFGPFAFYESVARTLSSHTIADFRVGRDVGLGMFGLRGSSVFSLGVRYANFDSTSDTQLSSQPTNARDPANLFHATAHLQRSFNGFGPSISWDASAPLLGSPQGGSIGLDWGANAAILFGRQSVRGNHQTNEQHRSGYATFASIYSHHMPISRNHTRSVPNVGGFAALSYRLQDVKLSVGYRADLFFGAVDGGIDTPRNFDRGFYGPFARLSVGIGG